MESGLKTEQLSSISDLWSLSNLYTQLQIDAIVQAGFGYNAIYVQPFKILVQDSCVYMMPNNQFG